MVDTRRTNLAGCGTLSSCPVVTSVALVSTLVYVVRAKEGTSIRAFEHSCRIDQVRVHRMMTVSWLLEGVSSGVHGVGGGIGEVH